MQGINNLGFLLIIIGILLVTIGSIISILEGRHRKDRNRIEEKEETKVGGVIFIGPIPIIFGSDKDTAKWALILGILMFVIYLVIIYFY